MIDLVVTFLTKHGASSGALVGLLILGAYVFGEVPGFAGFARADEVEANNRSISAQVAMVQQEISDSRVERIEDELLQLRLQHCHAKTDEARQLYWQRISSLATVYAKLTGHTYSVPDCANL